MKVEFSSKPYQTAYWYSFFLEFKDGTGVGGSVLVDHREDGSDFVQDVRLSDPGMIPDGVTWDEVRDEILSSWIVAPL